MMISRRKALWAGFSGIAAATLANPLFAATVEELTAGFTGGAAPGTDGITLTAPEIAENGAKVEVEVTCNIPNTRSLAVFADKNPMPLCSSIEFSGPALPYVREQLKLSETTRIRVVARTSDGKSHVAFREVKVTLGGCGG